MVVVIVAVVVAECSLVPLLQRSPFLPSTFWPKMEKEKGPAERRRNATRPPLPCSLARTDPIIVLPLVVVERPAAALPRARAPLNPPVPTTIPEGEEEDEEEEKEEGRRMSRLLPENQSKVRKE